MHPLPSCCSLALLLIFGLRCVFADCTVAGLSVPTGSTNTDAHCAGVASVGDGVWCTYAAAGGEPCTPVRCDGTVWRPAAVTCAPPPVPTSGSGGGGGGEGGVLQPTPLVLASGTLRRYSPSASVAVLLWGRHLASLLDVSHLRVAVSYDEASSVMLVGFRGGDCGYGGGGGDAVCGPRQHCVDSDGAANGVFSCVCHAPMTGEKMGGPAACRTPQGDCAAVPCGYAQQCRDDSAAPDGSFSCSCPRVGAWTDSLRAVCAPRPRLLRDRLSAVELGWEVLLRAACCPTLCAVRTVPSVFCTSLGVTGVVPALPCSRYASRRLCRVAAERAGEGCLWNATAEACEGQAGRVPGPPLPPPPPSAPSSDNGRYEVLGAGILVFLGVAVCVAALGVVEAVVARRRRRWEQEERAEEEAAAARALLQEKAAPPRPASVSRVSWDLRGKG